MKLQSRTLVSQEKHDMKYLSLLLVLVSFSSLSQSKDMKFTFDHYAINVADLDRSVDWYQKYFFVEEIYDGTEQEHIRWFSLGNNQELHIIMIPDFDFKVPKGIHMALTTSDLDSYAKFLEKEGVEYYDWPGEKGKTTTRPDKIKQLYVQDPDGYWIEVNDGITRFE